MPQLMPFYWMNSIMMVFVILFSMMFLYNFKNSEEVNNMLNKQVYLSNYNFMW